MPKPLHPGSSVRPAVRPAGRLWSSRRRLISLAVLFAALLSTLPAASPATAAPATAAPATAAEVPQMDIPDTAGGVTALLCRFCNPKEPPPPPPTYICWPSITKSISSQQTPDQLDYFSHITYNGRIDCTGETVIVGGVSRLIDRTSGSDGASIGPGGIPFGQTRGRADSPGAGDVFESTPGGRSVEVVLAVHLWAPDGIWTSCNPAPGLRFLRCDGLGTANLRIEVGTNPFATGLCPFQPPPPEPTLADPPNPDLAAPEDTEVVFDDCGDVIAAGTAETSSPVTAAARRPQIRCRSRSQAPSTISGSHIFGGGLIECTASMVKLSVHVGLWRQDNGRWQLVDIQKFTVTARQAVQKAVAATCRADAEFTNYVVTASHLMTPPAGYRPPFGLNFTRSKTVLAAC